VGKADPRWLTLDSGGLIAFEARDRRVNALIQQAKDLGRRIVIPANVVAQVWRGAGPRQARLAALLGSKVVSVQDFSHALARVAGELCARSGTADVVDASVVVTAWSNGRTVVTSDPEDLLRLDPTLVLVRV
jgi:predicted nucleic acid-binding protein